MTDRSETIGALATALAKAQGAMKPAARDKTNPFYKSKYADLASVWDSIRTPLSVNGLAVTQTITDTQPTALTIETLLLHASGEYMGSTMTVPTGKGDIQALGSAISYARRYALSALIGVVSDEEDDGEAAKGAPDSSPKPAAPVPKPATPVADAPKLAPVPAGATLSSLIREKAKEKETQMPGPASDKQAQACAAWLDSMFKNHGGEAARRFFTKTLFSVESCKDLSKAQAGAILDIIIERKGTPELDAYAEIVKSKMPARQEELVPDDDEPPMDEA